MNPSKSGPTLAKILQGKYPVSNIEIQCHNSPPPIVATVYPLEQPWWTNHESKRNPQIDNKRKTKIPTSEPGQIPKKVKVDSTVIATDHPVLEQPMMDLEEHSQNQELNGVKGDTLC